MLHAALPLYIFIRVQVEINNHTRTSNNLKQTAACKKRDFNLRSVHDLGEAAQEIEQSGPRVQRDSTELRVQRVETVVHEALKHEGCLKNRMHHFCIKIKYTCT